ncbi:MAG: glycine cleavage system aminomethyltransferase GcvT [Acidiferrobacterales bacterium]|nr:glycine cleavage system aminomethyltransferase GcvT [Acidiferrobacterales bacterium]
MSLLVSPLNSLHLELGAKMGPFAGYSMPIWYPEKIIAEHNHTRTQASLFDISHMGQFSVVGADAARVLEALIPTDLMELPSGKMKYCCLTNNQGGILDDLIASKLGADYFVVVNAACKQQDLKHLRENVAASSIVEHSENALLALQGPKAEQVLAAFNPDIAELEFLTIDKFDLNGVSCTVSRSGYTGEDGFEISVAARNAEELVRKLLKQPGVKPAGLGARDSLRLEAGLRLYGQDMDTATTPVEAGIHWTIPKVRRLGGEREGGFPGADVILKQLDQGPTRRLVGLRLHTKVLARRDTKILSADGTQIGIVTSGMLTPTVQIPIALGYVELSQASVGTTVNLEVRKSLVSAEVVRLPFVRHQYRTVA